MTTVKGPDADWTDQVEDDLEPATPLADALNLRVSSHSSDDAADGLEPATPLIGDASQKRSSAPRDFSSCLLALTPPGLRL